MAVDSDYEHWPDDDSSFEEEFIAASGYNNYNGLRAHNYHPANQEKEKSKSPTPEPAKPAPVTCVPIPQVASPQQVPYMMGYPGMQPMQYCYPQPLAYPAPAYYGYPPQMQAPPYAPAQGFAQVGEDTTAPAEKKKKKKPKKASPRKWQGRTKAEVEEDNMKIAAREGVCAPRQVEPKGLKDDQMVWCVETDGSHTLR